MFKKIINDDRSEEWNILMFAIIYTITLIIVLTPIILIGLSLHPELSETLTEAPSTSVEKSIDTINQINSIIEAFVVGTVLEFIRRKRSKKFKISDPQATKFLFYFSAGLFLYSLMLFIGGVIV